MSAKVLLRAGDVQVGMLASWGSPSVASGAVTRVDDRGDLVRILVAGKADLVCRRDAWVAGFIEDGQPVPDVHPGEVRWLSPFRVGG